MIVYDVTLEALPDQREAFASVLKDLAAASRSEGGCLAYRLSGDLDNPLRFYLLELWETEADLLAHAKGEGFQRFITALPKLGKLVSSVARAGALEPYVRPK